MTWGTRWARSLGSRLWPEPAGRGRAGWWWVICARAACWGWRAEWRACVQLSSARTPCCMYGAQFVCHCRVPKCPALTPCEPLFTRRLGLAPSALGDASGLPLARLLIEAMEASTESATCTSSQHAHIMPMMYVIIQRPYHTRCDTSLVQSSSCLPRHQRQQHMLTQPSASAPCSYAAMHQMNIHPPSPEDHLIQPATRPASSSPVWGRS